MTISQSLLPFNNTNIFFYIYLSLIYHISSSVGFRSCIWDEEKITIRIVSFSVHHLENQYCFFPIIGSLNFIEFLLTYKVSVIHSIGSSIFF